MAQNQMGWHGFRPPLSMPQAIPNSASGNAPARQFKIPTTLDTVAEDNPSPSYGTRGAAAVKESEMLELSDSMGGESPLSPNQDVEDIDGHDMISRIAAT